MFFFDVHTHFPGPQKNIISIVNEYPKDVSSNQHFSVGIHPRFISEEELEKEFQFLQKKINLKNCLAIGECGLDKLATTEYKTQLSVFKQHIEISEKHNKPLIIHCVRAYNDIINLKKMFNPKQPWIIHGFNKNHQIANDLIKNNIFLSFGNALSLNKKLQQIVKEIDSSKILLESDSSKKSIIDIYNTFASIKKQNINSVIEQINKNFNKIFTL